MKVAWIGLGSVGLPAALKVVAAGHQVSGYDVRPPAPEAAPGIALASSPRAASAGCDVVCVAVFSDDQLVEAWQGAEGILASLEPGAAIAVLTTGTPQVIRDLADTMPAGIDLLDTCFSRTRADIAAGTMTLLVGGDPAAIERARPVLGAFAHSIVHVGAGGAGRAIKLVNNILYAGHLQLAADALRLAEAQGLDPAATAEALTHCSGSSDVLRGFADASASEILEKSNPYMQKDVAAAVAAAEAAGLKLGPLGLATQTYLIH